MPIYDYRCSICKYEFSEIQSVKEEILSQCKKCGGKLIKLISLCSSNVEYKNSKELYEKVIKPDAKRIAEKIKNGDENEAANIFGESKE